MTLEIAKDPQDVLPLPIKKTIGILEDLVLTHQTNDKLLQKVLELVLANTHADQCAIFLLNARKRKLILQSSLLREGIEIAQTQPYAVKLTSDALVANVAKIQHPIRIDDFDKLLDVDDSELSQEHGRTSFNSALAVPLFTSDDRRVTGILVVESLKPYAFSSADEALLINLARYAMYAIKTAQVEEASQDIGNMVIASDANELLDATVRALCSILHVAVGSIWLYDQFTNRLVLRKAVGRKVRPETTDRRIPIENSLLGQVVKTMQPAQYANVQLEPGFLHGEMAKKHNWRSTLIVPIVANDNKLLGVISVYSTEIERNFSPFEVDLALKFSQQIAISLQVTSLFQKSEELQETMVQFNQLCNQLVTITDQKILQQEIALAAQTIVKGDGAILYLWEASQEFAYAEAVSGAAHPLQFRRAHLNTSLAGWLIRYAQTTRASSNDRRLDKSLAKLVDLRFAIATPLIRDGDVKGALIVFKQGDKSVGFTDANLLTLESIASQATVAINRLELHTGMERHATRLNAVMRIQAENKKFASLRKFLEKCAKIISEELGCKVDIGLNDKRGVQLYATHHDGSFISVNPMCIKRHYPFGTGVIGTVGATGIHMLLDDVDESDVYSQCFQNSRSELAVPIFSDGLVTGVLNLESKDLRAFSEVDLSIASMLSAHLADAIHETQNQVSMRKLKLVLERATNAETRQALTNLLVEELIALPDIDSCSVLLLGSNGRQLHLVAHQGIDGELARKLRIVQPGETISGMVFADGKYKTFRNVQTDIDTDGLNSPTDPSRALLCMPLRGKDRIIGVFGIGSNQVRDFRRDEINLADSIGSAIGTALEKLEVTRNYEHLFHGAKDAIVFMRSDGNIIKVNPQTERLTGFNHDQLVAMNIVDLLDESFDRTVIEQRLLSLSHDVPVPTLELAIETASGQTRFIESNPTLMRDEIGNVIEIQSIWRDITDHYKDRIAIQQQAERQNVLRNLNRVSLDRFSVEQMIVWAEENLCRVLKGSFCKVYANLEGEHPKSLRSLHSDNPLSVAIQHAITAKESVIKNDQLDYHNVDIANHAQPRDLHHLIVTPMLSPNRPLGVIVLTRHANLKPQHFSQDDLEFVEMFAENLALVLEYGRLDEIEHRRSAAAQTLEHMRVLGAFLSHKLGGFLGGVALAAREIGRRLEPADSNSQRLVDYLGESCNNINAIVEQFRNLNSFVNNEPDAVNCAELIGFAVYSPKNRANNITVHSLNLDLPAVKAHHRQLMEVFEGLISNAVDAIGDDRGELIIEGRKHPSGLYVEIDFTDNGTGIPEDVQERIFDPFFSTKPISQGIGAGLWISRLYLEMIGGSIDITRKNEPGTTLTVRLPIHEEPPLQSVSFWHNRQEIEFEIPDSWRAEQTLIQDVLVVEDDPFWNDVVLPNMLHRRGIEYNGVYNLLEARAAISEQTFDAYIVDVRLVDYESENEDGFLLVNEILQHDPNATIIILSGWIKALRNAQKRFEAFDNVIILNKAFWQSVENAINRLTPTEDIQ